MSGVRILEGVVIALLAGIVLVLLSGVPRQTLLEFFLHCHTAAVITGGIQVLIVYRIQAVVWKEDPEASVMILCMALLAFITIEAGMMMLQWEAFCSWLQSFSQPS